jgi:hypothetical protein
MSWQNLTWLFFHKLTLNQEKGNNLYFKKFFGAFKSIIPCSICRDHYNEVIQNENQNISKNTEKMNLFNWTIDIHNNVNLMHGKRKWSYKEARKYYRSTFLTPTLTKEFIMQYIFYNYRKGPEKTRNLIEMTKALLYIFPRHHVRHKLIEFHKKFPVTKENYQKWITAILLIIRKEMK